MQMCPYCDKVYDESEYSGCPYCSGELSDDSSGEKIKNCPLCEGGVMHWEEFWFCSNCGHEIYTGEDDYDDIWD
ncbi:MAG: hypothetical protein IJB68_04415 [Ruminococcus sp.]|nr:hypothetical protein [Ruminococcus sp.]